MTPPPADSSPPGAEPEQPSGEAREHPPAGTGSGRPARDRPPSSGETGSCEAVLGDGSVLCLVHRPSPGDPTSMRDRGRLGQALAAAAAHLEETREAEATAPEVSSGDTVQDDPSAFGARYGLIGDSPSMRGLFRLLARVGPSEATVLVTGENGTGKELVARAIHASSRRAEGRFVAINCSAFQDELLESELFGHVRGAFTGAVADKPGLFDMAHQGTLFLDEVGDMSPALQVKLLRVLQESTFQPVGGVETRRVDVRILAATNRDLGARVAEGAFREDLYYRLNVVHLRVPPLRDRPGDVDRLVNRFLARLSERHAEVAAGTAGPGPSKRLSPQVMAELRAYRWPGNVRELENEVERLWVLSGADAVVGAEHLSPSIRRERGNGGSGFRGGDDDGPRGDDGRLPEGTLPDAVEALERGMIAAALARHGGNKTRAAAELGVSRRNLIRKVQAYGLDGAAAEKREPR